MRKLAQHCYSVPLITSLRRVISCEGRSVRRKRTMEHSPTLRIDLRSLTRGIPGIAGPSLSVPHYFARRATSSLVSVSNAPGFRSGRRNGGATYSVKPVYSDALSPLLLSTELQSSWINLALFRSGWNVSNMIDDEDSEVDVAGALKHSFSKRNCAQ